ncbi:amino acid ABC transporter substrate-binding protein [Tissierella sp. Yu-01]|uniref:amino acid ABC transporter substrate-binding protein n=1 Tax=Tissierella sp. Yu-01 TaxID=3035694 RepID=UPI00240D45AD|nr:amino acid ABC transporter substrate-binding protein [Tissierella sp. Yu-01]WFA10451.1 amino acid ABC transporter substrate-binding protein [Tissierella sp. Yu-01]
MLNKKSILFLLVVTIITSLMVGCSSQSGTSSAQIQESTKEKTTYIVGLDDTFAPMGFRDENGNLVGFDLDLANEVANRWGVTFEFQPIDWSMKETELTTGNIDFIWNGYTITKERKEKVNFSEPYLQYSQLLVTLADSPINSIKDMAGMVVSTQGESSAVDAAYAQPGLVESFKNGELVEFPTYNEVFNDLEAGRSDIVIADEVLARYYMKNKGAEKYKILDENLGLEEFAVGLRKEDTQLLDKLNTTLNEIKEDGTYDEIYSKWFSEN